MRSCVPQEWNDYNLRWNESEFGGVKDLRITPNKIWRPDILMYNSVYLQCRMSFHVSSEGYVQVSIHIRFRKQCPLFIFKKKNCCFFIQNLYLIIIINNPIYATSADEGFDGTYHTNVVVKHNGSCLYVPPGIFKSTCKIDITWFPFDDQHCDMKFGSWTYDGNQVFSALQLTSVSHPVHAFK
uniref:Neurotransmitter-gated ion-channel ligand-binding domain-containing protein n=1 Tax=Timema shepardi TaxID=629360 RepID=A0A7R9APQ7_TIMSH|nr:unnamed protein product [Timema shepardi]